jgi:hypothetical protein
VALAFCHTAGGRGRRNRRTTNINTLIATKFEGMAKAAFGAHGEKLISMKHNKYYTAARQVGAGLF